MCLICLWNRKIGLSDKISKIFSLLPERNSLVYLGGIYFSNVTLPKTNVKKNSILQFLVVFLWVIF